jgi:hypothetical protein
MSHILFSSRCWNAYYKRTKRHHHTNASLEYQFDLIYR